MPQTNEKEWIRELSECSDVMPKTLKEHQEICYNMILDALSRHDKGSCPFVELLKSQEEIDEMVKKGELVLPIEKSKTKNWESELDILLIHDPDHKWYWKNSCCQLKEKLKVFIADVISRHDKERTAEVVEKMGKFETILRSMDYQTPSQLRRSSQGQYGLDYEEALEMAYDNLRVSVKELTSQFTKALTALRPPESSYCDSRTQEEKDNEPESTLTTASILPPEGGRRNQ